MEFPNLEALLGGQHPTRDDYSYFISLCEKLPIDPLWRVATQFPNMQPLLRHVIQKNLAEKIPKKISTTP